MRRLTFNRMPLIYGQMSLNASNKTNEKKSHQPLKTTPRLKKPVYTVRMSPISGEFPS